MPTPEETLQAILEELRILNAREHRRSVLHTIQYILSLLPTLMLLFGGWYVFEHLQELITVALSSTVQTSTSSTSFKHFLELFSR